MFKSMIELPDGRVLSSGPGAEINIRNTSLTECVNSGEELTMGSTCAAMMELVVQAPRGALVLKYGDEVTLYRVDSADVQKKVGRFILEKPSRTSTYILKLTGYDRVVKLDKDLTSWLKSLSAWPYPLIEFAGMVCSACGLELVTTEIPNGDYMVQKIKKEATGRQLMQWIGEICCRFCRATPDGAIELAWYSRSGLSIQPTGENYFFRRTLTYQDCDVAPIEAVQVQLIDSEDSAPIPAVPNGTHSYVISGNPIFTVVTSAVVDTIAAELRGMTYTPCKVTVPAFVDAHPGDIIEISDLNGVTITTPVMTRTQRGQRATLESTGSPRRDSSTTLYNATSRDQAANTARTAYTASMEAVNGQTPEGMFKQLTGNGQIQGFYLHDGRIYINGEFVSIVNLVAQSIVSGLLRSINGRACFDLDRGLFSSEGEPSEDGCINGLRLQDAMLQGLCRTQDGETPTFELMASGDEIRLTDGTVAPSGLPMRIWSTGGLDLGREGEPVTLLGKQLAWVQNEDGQTFSLVGIGKEEVE